MTRPLTRRLAVLRLLTATSSCAGLAPYPGAYAHTHVDLWTSAEGYAHRVRAAAAKGLGEQGAKDGEDSRREAIPHCCGRCGRCGRCGPMARLAAAEGLGAPDGRGVEDALLGALSDGEAPARRAALRSLRQLGCELPEPLLGRDPEDPNPFVRNEASFWKGDEGWMACRGVQSITVFHAGGIGNRAADQFVVVQGILAETRRETPVFRHWRKC